MLTQAKEIDEIALIKARLFLQLNAGADADKGQTVNRSKEPVHFESE